LIIQSNMKKKDTSPIIRQRDKLKGKLELKPFTWTDKQKEFIQLALDKETKMIFVEGPAGSAKTLLATYCALELLNQKSVAEIMYLRSAVESADSKLGFLPGELEDKFYYYGVPFLDKLDELLTKPQIDLLVKETRVNVFPINYVRGQSWAAKCIIVDEAQNLTRKELVTVLTRIGERSKAFVLADPMQSDINGKSGAFVSMAELFNDQESCAQGIRYFKLEESDIMRSALCRFLVNRFKYLDQKERH
jgi:phosphate starvation-inducible protein PhoH and related proteins